LNGWSLHAAALVVFVAMLTVCGPPPATAWSIRMVPDAAGASPSWLRLATYAGARGTGSPALLFREDSFLDSTDARI